MFSKKRYDFCVLDLKNHIDQHSLTDFKREMLTLAKALPSSGFSWKCFCCKQQEMNIHDTDIWNWLEASYTKSFHGQISEIHPTNISLYLPKIQPQTKPQIFLSLHLFREMVLDISFISYWQQKKIIILLNYSMINYSFAWVRQSQALNLQ